MHITIANLTPEQRARNGSEVAARLRAVLEDARREHEAAEISALAAADQRGIENAADEWRAQIAASIAEDAARVALLCYVVRGCCSSDLPEPDIECDDAMLDACRIARKHIKAQIDAILSSSAPLSGFTDGAGI
jgi:hypothetical protein